MDTGEVTAIGVVDGGGAGDEEAWFDEDELLESDGLLELASSSDSLNRTFVN